MMKITICVLFFGFALAHSSVVKREQNFVQTSEGGEPENIDEYGNEEEKKEQFVNEKEPGDGQDHDKNKNKGNGDDFVLSGSSDGGKNKNGLNVGTFWHLSDMHLDFLYNLKSSNKSAICPSSFGRPAINPGPYGDYRYLFCASNKMIHNDV